MPTVVISTGMSLKDHLATYHRLPYEVADVCSHSELEALQEVLPVRKSHHMSPSGTPEAHEQFIHWIAKYAGYSSSELRAMSHRKQRYAAQYAVSKVLRRGGYSYRHSSRHYGHHDDDYHHGGHHHGGHHHGGHHHGGHHHGGHHHGGHHHGGHHHGGHHHGGHHRSRDYLDDDRHYYDDHHHYDNYEVVEHYDDADADHFDHDVDDHRHHHRRLRDYVPRVSVHRPHRLEHDH